MAEIPDHLLKRAEEAKARASSEESNEPSSAQSSETKVPEELLDRTKAASDRDTVLSLIHI